MGIVLVADGPGRRWAERHLIALGTLIGQFAWSRRALILTDLLKTQREDLERMNWYKHRRLEDIHRVLGTGIRRLNELGTRQDALTGTRHQQILRQDSAIFELAEGELYIVLLHDGLTFDHLSGLPRFAQRWQEDRDQQRDDRHNHQKFD